MKIIGIDLGTTNTYLYGSNTSPDSASGSEQEQPHALILPLISDDSGSIATVVLYEHGQPYLAGNIAESEFFANVDKQASRMLASQFKPEIAQGTPDAMRAMTDFLRLILAALPEGTLEANTGIYVGMPSLAREDFGINLGNCFTQAGWPRPVFVRESDAALVSCLQSGTLDLDDVERKCVILDFGGGTCDYTTVESMDVLQNGGDILYGGRLFDDMFYEVFCAHDEMFARMSPKSSFAWYVHWVECRAQKEKFSDYLRTCEAAGNRGFGSAAVVESRAIPEKSDPQCSGFSLHAAWYLPDGQRQETFVHDYDRDIFIRDAENYSASPQMLTILAEYAGRGGLSAQARDLLAGRRIGLISWLRSILDRIDRRGDVAKIVLTGGSSRWPFVKEIAIQMFPGAECVHSRRSFEDIAFGLALFPLLLASRDRVRKLLDEKIAEFTLKATNTARDLMRKQSGSLVRLCSDRIVSHDVMPALEAAQKSKMTVEELEKSFTDNIKNDSALLEIAREKSNTLREEIQDNLNFAFRNWLRENGVLLVPRFVFPAQAIGQEFFNTVSVKISRLDSLNLMKFTLTTILPLLVGGTTAVTIAHSLEPVSTVAGGGLAFGVTWLLARTAPKLLEKRKLPSFLLTESNRKKIADKNREFIEKSLSSALAEVEANMEVEIERRLRNVMTSMLGRLTVLNQVKTFY